LQNINGRFVQADRFLYVSFKNKKQRADIAKNGSRPFYIKTSSAISRMGLSQRALSAAAATAVVVTTTAAVVSAATAENDDKKNNP
jgi:hypothetical protein